MAHWKISLLGDLSIRSSSGRQIKVRPDGWTLLAFLVAAPSHSVSRGALASAMAPDANEATACHRLATTLWRLKCALRGGPALIESSDDHVALRLSPTIWIDVLAFDSRMSALRFCRPGTYGPIQLQRLNRAIVSYSGDFATSLEAPWALIERERLRSLFIDGLFALAVAHSTVGEWQSVVRIARQLCYAEPLREDAHRLLMTALSKTGNRALALKQFEQCRSILARELNVEPMSETIALQRGLLVQPQAELPMCSDDLKTAIPEGRQNVRDALNVLEAALVPPEDSEMSPIEVNGVAPVISR